MWMVDQEKISLGVYSGCCNASFGVASPQRDALDRAVVDYWTACRDVFLPYQPGLKSFYYCHGQEELRGQAIAIFLDRAERRLKIRKEDRSIVQPTTRRDIVKIYPSRFWDRYHLRRSFFTILVRAGEIYSPAADNFEDSLCAAKNPNYPLQYARETRYAVDRFFSGKTHPRPSTDQNSRGWCRMFDGKTKAQINSILRAKKFKTKSKKVATPEV